MQAIIKMIISELISNRNLIKSQHFVLFSVRYPSSVVRRLPVYKRLAFPSHQKFKQLLICDLIAFSLKLVELIEWPSCTHISSSSGNLHLEFFERAGDIMVELDKLELCGWNGPSMRSKVSFTQNIFSLYTK